MSTGVVIANGVKAWVDALPAFLDLLDLGNTPPTSRVIVLWKDIANIAKIERWAPETAKSGPKHLQMYGKMEQCEIGELD